MDIMVTTVITVMLKVGEVIITHDDKLVCRFAERIVLLEEGRVVADGIPAKKEIELGMEAAF